MAGGPRTALTSKNTPDTPALNSITAGQRRYAHDRHAHSVTTPGGDHMPVWPRGQDGVRELPRCPAAPLPRWPAGPLARCAAAARSGPAGCRLPTGAHGGSQRLAGRFPDVLVLALVRTASAEDWDAVAQIRASVTDSPS